MKKTILFLLIVTTIIPAAMAGLWTQKASCPMMRKTSFSFSIGTKGYTGCGRDSLENLTKSFWEYDQTTDSWTQKADFTGFPREGPAGFAINGKGYAGLGYNDAHGGALQDFYAYDTATNAWTQKAFFQGLGGGYAVSFTIGSFGYVCTGKSMTADYQELWQYDPSTDSWNQKLGITGIGRQQAMGFVIGGTGYVLGGFSLADTLLLNDMWAYNPVTDSWTQKANTPGHARCDAATFAIGGKGYMGVGDTAGGDLKDFWAYDTTTNSWTSLANFPGMIRDETTYFAIGNKGYIGLGGENGVFYDFWEYNPDAFAGIVEAVKPITTKVFPNPIKDKASITFNRIIEKGMLKIFNEAGQIVRVIPLAHEKEVALFKENIEAGIYLYEITESGTKISASGKIIIE